MSCAHRRRDRGACRDCGHVLDAGRPAERLRERLPLADLTAELADALLSTLRASALALAAARAVASGRPPHDIEAERDLLWYLLTCDVLLGGRAADPARSCARQAALSLVEDLDVAWLSRVHGAVFSASTAALELGVAPSVARVDVVACELLGVPPGTLRQLLSEIVSRRFTDSREAVVTLAVARVRARAPRLRALQAIERARLELLAPDADDRVVAAALSAACAAMPEEVSFA